METTAHPPTATPAEIRAASTGFILVGIGVAVTAVSYVLNMTFTLQWLVWSLGVAFAAVAILALEWPRSFLRLEATPHGRVRGFLLVSMPMAFVLGSQVCGTGLKACTVACHVTNIASIALAGATAIRAHQRRSVAPTLIPLIVVALVPHCVCSAPVNVIWHGIFGGYAPTCGLVPMAAVLFSVAALKGARPRLGATLTAVMLGVIVFMAVGNPLIGFPWEGCVG